MKENTKVIEETKEIMPEVEEQQTEESMPKKGLFTRAGEFADKHVKTAGKILAGAALAVGGFALGTVLKGSAGSDDHDEVDETVHEAEFTVDDDE